MSKKRKTIEYSREEGNLSVIKNKEEDIETSSSSGLKLNSNGLKMGSGANVVIGKININSSFKKRHEKHYRNNKFHLIADLSMAVVIVLLLLAVLWLSFWQPKKQVDLSSKASSTIKSGALETFVLNYQTRNKAENVSLSVKLPDNFELVDTFPKSYNKANNTFKLPNMSAGSNGEIKIIGYVFGELGSHQGLGFVFNCSTCGKNGVLNSLLYNIENSAIDMRVISPDKFYNNLETPVRISLKNTSSKNLYNIILEASNEWHLTNNENIFNNKLIIDELISQETKEFDLSLVPLSDKKEINLSLDLKIEKDKILYTQNTFKKIVAISDPQLKTSLNIESLDLDKSKIVNFSLKYRNQEIEDISNLNFKIKIPEGFNLKNLHLKESNANLEIIDDLIVVKRSPIKNQEQIVNFSAELERQQVRVNQSLQIFVETSYTQSNQMISYEVASRPLKLNSQIKAEAKAYYYSPQGDQIGIGPMPPTVGLPTTYWIFLDISNFGNHLSDINLSGQLAKNVFWENEISLLQGNLHYGPSNKSFVWKINSLEPEDEANSRLALRLQADKDMIGETPTLLENMVLSAYDNFTKETISYFLEDIDTNLIFDKLSQNQGEVKP